MADRFMVTPWFLDRPLPALASLAQPDWAINRPVLPAANLQERLSCLHRPLATFVAAELTAGHRPVSIAGDCCTAIGVAAGIRRAGLDATLIWFDAHGDFNTWDTTPSGFLGGMPLAMIAGLGEQTMVEAVGLRPLGASQIVLTDARDLDPGERLLVQESGLMHLPEVGSLLDIPLPAGPLHVHFDTDVLNPQEAPAMSYPAAGGPAAPELEAVFRRLAHSGQVAAVSVSTWNPDLDGDGQTQARCLALLEVLLEPE